MSQLVILLFIIAAVVSILNSSSKRRTGKYTNRRERWANTQQPPAPPAPAPRRSPRMKGSFADLVAQFDAQREQEAEAHAEGQQLSGSMIFESTEGLDTPGHDHGFATTEPHPPNPTTLTEGGGPRDQGKEEASPRPPITHTQLRQAIVMAEILGKPASQRRRT